ncbi:multi-sensor hybrid histidine kinase [Candidatus Magnetomorum sp. HK-1]|nr:multi-sensor hybrid histidine kinase [Candidatus Magnetomorum sp. HK-1]
MNEKHTYEDFEKENTFNRILNSISDGFFILNNELEVVFFNNSAELLLGRKRQDILGSNLFVAFPEAKGSIFEEKYTLAVKEKKMLTFETYFDTQPYQNWYEVRVYPHQYGIIVYFQVTTERKQKEIALSNSEAKLRTITSTALDSIFCKDLDRKYTFVNPSMAKLLGSNEIDLLGKTPEELFGAEEAATINDVDQRTFRGEKVSEIRTLAINGKAYTFHTIQMPLRNKDEKVIGITGIVRDITKIKQAESTLRKSQQLYNDLVETAHDLIWRCDEKGRYIYLNKACERIFGYHANEMLGRSFTDFMDGEIAERDMRQFKSLLEENGFVSDYETTHRKKDGNPVHLLFNAKIYQNEQGHVLGTQGTAQDISERKKIEENLIRNEKKYKSLFNSTNDGISLHEIIYNKNEPIDYRILDVNPKYEELTGIKKEDAIGATASHLYETCKAPYLETYAKVAETGESTTFETYFKPMDKHFIISVFSPEKTQFATVFQDVTERKKYEKQLQQTQKLEAIGTLAGGIAHDFNNMCAVITGNLSYALSIIDPQSELYDVLSDIQKGANQAKKLTNQLLTFSKGGTPIKEPADLNELVVESANFMLRGTKSKCSFDLSNDLLPCEVDKGQLSQVIGNLVLNANQAMPYGGRISIRTENLFIKANKVFPLFEGQYIKIRVEDEGVGISEKHIPNIFDPFFTTKQQGSGLGLATAYSIIKKHKGHITVFSELDKGTVFQIYLPASSKSIEKTLADEQVTHQGKGKVLIMDDQEPIFKMLDRMLIKMG